MILCPVYSSRLSRRFPDPGCVCSSIAQEVAAIENEEKNTVYAPVNGRVVEMGDIPDPTFSEGVLGWTMGIYPEDGIVRAPFSGKVVQVSDTGHAIGFTC